MHHNRYILQSRLPIDAGVLCDFLDTVSSALVVIYRARPTLTFHTMVLPRAWLLSVAGLFLDESTPDKLVGKIGDYVKVVEIILQRLRTRGPDTGAVSSHCRDVPSDFR